MTDSAPPLVAVGDDRNLKVTLDVRTIAMVIARAPKIAHFWIQGFLHRCFVLHRLEWFKRKGTKFGRRGEGGASNAIKVHPINEGPANPTESDVVYRVHPREQKASSVAAAVQGLQEMQAEVFTGNIVLPVHEFGADIQARAAGRLAIAVKTRPKSPRRWAEKYPDKKLEFRPSKKVPGEGLLYEVTKVRGRGRPRKGESMPVLKEKLRLRFILKRVVHMKPKLGFYRTWEDLSAARDTLWRGAADKMLAQLQHGDPRDF